MPRPLRHWVPDGVYHLTARGNDRQVIFLDQADYRQYLLELNRSRVEYPCRILAFALMPNHVHLLIEAVDDASTSEMMHRLATSYTRYFNSRHDRVGHLYQGRFYSSYVHRDPYLLEVSRYIHVNPVRACLALRPAEYRWSSYRIYRGLERDPWGMVECDRVLSLFGESTNDRIQRYRQFIEDLSLAEIERRDNRLRRQKLIPSQRWLNGPQPLAQKVPGTFPRTKSARHFCEAGGKTGG